MPEEYFAPSDHPGQVVEITYDSRDYTDAAEPAIQKAAYVYLPYGYDEADQETRYDVLYLMHGWTMTAGSSSIRPRAASSPCWTTWWKTGTSPR